MPPVSVIIPTFNRAHTLKRAIDSVLNQTYRDFEIIIVDDGSTDHTADVVDTISDNRIKYICIGNNRGPAFARNVGIRESKGQFITFNDSDDMWLSNKLEQQIRYFRENVDSKLGVVFTRAQHIIGKRSYYVPRKNQGFIGDILKQMLETNQAWLQSLMIRRTVVDRVGLMDESFKILDDWDYTIRLANVCHFGYISDPLVVINDTPLSQSKNLLLIAGEYNKIYSKHRVFYIKDKKIQMQILSRIGNHFCLCGKMKEGRHYMYLSIKTKESLQPLVLLILSFLGTIVYKQFYKLIFIIRYNVSK